MSKIMRVYYDNAGHPYKDYSLSTLYPIVGNEFTGANNTTEIHFYTDNLGIATWVANCKLPNGSLLNRLLVPEIDGDGHTYFNLPLDSELTSVVGHLKIGLNGYAGNISIDEEELENNDLVVISGTPTIIATGIIDIAMNYSPITIPISSLTPTEYQELLAIIGSKLDSNKGIIVVEQLDNDNVVGSNGQLVYDKTTKLFYRVVNGAYQLENIDIGELQVNGNKLKLVLNGIASDISDINSALATKLDKIYTANKLYGTDDVGQQKAYSVMDIVNQVEITTLADYYNKAQIDEKDQAIMEVAEGKCKTYILSDKITRIEDGHIYHLDENNQEAEDTYTPDVFYVYNDTTGEWEDKHIEFENGDYNSLNIVNTDFDTQDSLIDYSQEAAAKYILIGSAYSSSVYLMSVSGWITVSPNQFNSGDIFLVIETDVPDRWYNGGGGFYKLETTKVDLTNYALLTGNNTFDGNQEFTGGITKNVKYYVDTYFYNTIKLSNNNGYYADIIPLEDNKNSIGAASYRIKDIYFSGNLSDGTNYYTVADSYNILFNKYSSTAASSVELDYALIKSIGADGGTLTLTLKSAPSLCKPEYKCDISNIGATPVVVSFPQHTKILTNDDNIIISNNVATLPVGVSVEVSIVDRNAIIINFDVA